MTIFGLIKLRDVPLKGSVIVWLALMIVTGVNTVGAQNGVQKLDTVFVEPDEFPNGAGALNRAIEANGEGAVYILFNGKSYFLTEPLAYQHKLRIQAAVYPSENPPIIRQASNFLGVTFDMARYQGDVDIRGVFFHALDDIGLQNSHQNLNMDNGRFEFRHSYFSFGSYIFGVNADNITLIIEDCYISNTGNFRRPESNWLVRVQPPYMERNHQIDSLVIINTAIYQMGNLLEMHESVTNYLYIDHVTVTNQAFFGLDLGLTRHATVKNSLFQNRNLFGTWEAAEIAGDQSPFFRDKRYVATDGLVSITSYEGVLDPEEAIDADRSITIRNNNFGGFPDEEYLEFWQRISQDDHEQSVEGAGTRPWITDPEWLWNNPDTGEDDPGWSDRDSIRVVRIHPHPLDSTLNAWQEQNAPWAHIEDNIEEKVTFSEPPDSMVHWLEAYWFRAHHPENPYPVHFDRWDSISHQSGHGVSYSENRFFHPAPGKPARSEGLTTAWWRDLSYSTGAASFTAAENGYPAGNLNYYPELREQWEKGVVQDVPTGAAGPGSSDSRPQAIALPGNYPNPFNPVTQIPFELPAAAQVRLDVYDVLGRRVATLVNEQVQAGDHRVSFDATGLSSGVYIARMQARDEVRTLRMMLVK